MSLIKVNELLQHATEHHYGVPAINVINTETIRYAIQAAEDEHMPLIIQYWPGFEGHCALDIIAFLGVYLGAEPVAAIVNQIPANVMSGLNAVGALLPAVGMALLLQMLWSTELSIYFFLGFTLYQYLGLPMIAIAVLGVIIAVASALRDKEIFDLTKKGLATQAVSNDSVTSDEEDFFA